MHLSSAQKPRSRAGQEWVAGHELEAHGGLCASVPVDARAEWMYALQIAKPLNNGFHSLHSARNRLDYLKIFILQKTHISCANCYAFLFVDRKSDKRGFEVHFRFYITIFCFFVPKNVDLNCTFKQKFSSYRIRKNYAGDNSRLIRTFSTSNEVSNYTAKKVEWFARHQDYELVNYIQLFIL